MNSHNQYVIKRYSDGYYKLSVTPRHCPKDPDKLPNIYEGKLHNSISRARNMIFELALCNDFTHFVTLTLDPQKYQRDDLKKFIKDLSQFIRDTRRRTGADIQYLLIPERHKDGKSWHMHGLINGLTCSNDLKLFTLQDNIPLKLRQLIQQGHKIYNWLPYASKFGWVTVEEIKSKLAVSKYVTKYATKHIHSLGVNKKNWKMYYHSRKLKGAERIAEGPLSDSVMRQLHFDYTSYIKNEITEIDIFIAGIKELNQDNINEYIKILSN